MKRAPGSEVGSDKPPSGAPGAPDAASILVVDDEELVRWALRERLGDDGYAVHTAASYNEARAKLSEREYDLVLLDCQLPDGDGMVLLREVHAEHKDTLVIMLTAHSTVQRAVTAMAEGAFYFIDKPFDLDQVLLIVQRALETTRLRRQVRDLIARDPEGSATTPLLGESTVMLEVKELIRRYAKSKASTVLVTGETGVGKDVAARALHVQSERRDKPFVNITCSALPEHLLESELFGHERGAFTDAKQRQIGLLEQANGGTVFLDEIGDMALGLQAKLLRFLEERAFRRVGGHADIKPDVRVIAATNRDLLDAVKQGHFRQDLYFRLDVLRIALPPLRARGGDIALLSAYFVDRFSRTLRKPVREISSAALAQLESYDWPGNVRELRNVIERAVLLCEQPCLQISDLRLLAGQRQSASQPPSAAHFVLPEGGIDVEDLVRNLVAQALERCAGNKTRAATLLGMTRDQIRYRTEKYGWESAADEAKSS